MEINRKDLENKFRNLGIKDPVILNKLVRDSSISIRTSYDAGYVKGYDDGKASANQQRDWQDKENYERGQVDSL